MSQRNVDAGEVWALARLGRQLFTKGRDDAAESVFRGIVAVWPEYGYAWHMLGRLSRRARDAAQAVDCFRRHLSVEAEAQESRLALAETLYGMNRRDEAIDALSVWSSSSSKKGESPVVRRGRVLVRRWSDE
jgi:tetratricopeptide (TPR) repeat protein